MALSSKLWVWQSLLSFKPENSDFNHVDKIGPSCEALKDENKTSHGPLWYWVKVIHNSKKYLKSKVFSKSKFDDFLPNIGVRKKCLPVPTLGPRGFLWTIFVKNRKISKIWHGLFVYFVVMKIYGVFTFILLYSDITPPISAGQGHNDPGHWHKVCHIHIIKARSIKILDFVPFYVWIVPKNSFLEFVFEIFCKTEKKFLIEGSPLWKKNRRYWE